MTQVKRNLKIENRMRKHVQNRRILPISFGLQKLEEDHF
jgi:hypothetical protein